MSELYHPDVETFRFDRWTKADEQLFHLEAARSTALMLADKALRRKNPEERGGFLGYASEAEYQMSEMLREIYRVRDRKGQWL